LTRGADTHPHRNQETNPVLRWANDIVQIGHKSVTPYTTHRENHV